MSSPTHPHDALTVGVAHFRSGDAMRSRSVAHLVLAQNLELPALPLRLTEDWKREISLNLQLVPGDVESLSLPRARMRWPGYMQCVEAVDHWMRTLGLPDLIGSSDVALMACRGADVHHDGVQYGDKVFCNLFLGSVNNLDLYFPATGQRFALQRGTVVVFDPSQPHAVIGRQTARFDPADFASGGDDFQVFLTWELPVEDARVARALHISFDIAPFAELFKAG
jgi:hypothetical protein